MINDLRKPYFPQSNLCRMKVNFLTPPGLVSVPGVVLCGPGGNPALAEPNLCTTGGKSPQPSGQCQHTRADCFHPGGESPLLGGDLLRLMTEGQAYY